MKTINVKNKEVTVCSTGNVYYKNKKLKQVINRSGYPEVTICKRHYRVHRLVAEAYLPLPTGSTTAMLVVHHKDHVRTNNNAPNLEWMTRTEHLKLHKANTPLKKARVDNELSCKGVYRWNVGNRRYRSVIQDDSNNILTIGYWLNFETAIYAYGLAHQIKYGVQSGASPKNSTINPFTKADAQLIKAKIKAMGME